MVEREEVLTLTKSSVTHYDPEMIRDPDWFYAFQPSADRLTPDTIHNTGKHHVCVHGNAATPRGVEGAMVEVEVTTYGSLAHQVFLSEHEIFRTSKMFLANFWYTVILNGARGGYHES